MFGFGKKKTQQVENQNFQEWITGYATDSLSELPQESASRIVSAIAADFLNFDSWTEAGSEAIRQQLRRQLDSHIADYQRRKDAHHAGQNELRQHLPQSVARKASHICGYGDGVVTAMVGGVQRYYSQGRELSPSESFDHQYHSGDWTE